MVISIGIKGARQEELVNIASDPSLVYQMRDYSQLDSQLANLQSIIREESCFGRYQCAVSPHVN